MARKLDNKIALITGATTGIGLATAQRFAAEGAHVYITGRRQAELDAAVSTIVDAGGKVTGVRIDHPHRLYSRKRGYRSVQRVFGIEGCCALVRLQLDSGFEGSPSLYF